MNIYEELILVKGEDKTTVIDQCIYKNNTYEIVYKSSPQVWNYAETNVQKLTNPKSILPSSVSVWHGKKKLFNIKTILEFGQEYWRIIYQNGKIGLYSREQLTIEENSLSNAKVKDCFGYFKRLSETISIKTDDGSSFLANQYKKIDFIGKDTVLNQYLSSNASCKQRSLPECIIYPFGCNVSQMEAVEKALTHQVSVIEGPPGTGKTQTILNIIANLVMAEKTVAIVSNNNSATDNVFEKLEKNGFSFIAATLGKKENKEQFITNQIQYPNFDQYPKNRDEITKFKEAVLIQQSKLKEMLDSQNQMARLKSQLEALELEQQYFKTYYEETYKKIEKLKKLSVLTAEEVLKLWGETQNFIENEKSISFWFKLKGFLKHKIYDWHFFNQSTEKIIADFQYIYYELRQQEIKKEIDNLKKILDQYSFEDKLKEMMKQSLFIFKYTLWKKYGEKENRSMFVKEDLWKHSQKITQEYPVILSTTYSIKSSLNPEMIYDYVIVDEASQVDLITGVLTLSCARNIVVVGDLMQLPNVVSSEVEALLGKFSDSTNIEECYRYETNSLLSSVEKAVQNVPRTLLREHYRCHPRIIEFCNKKFYNNELIVMTEDKKEEDVLKVYKTVVGNHARGHLNKRQIDEIKQGILPELRLGKVNYDIGIISPYKVQTEAVKEEVKGEIDISTVHKFQGREKEDIIICTVDNEISEFVDNPNLLNVAVSRAKKRLRVVVSDHEKNAGTNIGDLVKYIQYNNFEVVTGKVYSVFDLLYQDYAKERAKYLKKQNRVSEYDSENIMYVLIMEILQELKNSNLGVLVHQPLKMLIRDAEKLSDEECKYAMNYATHLDFLVYNKLDKKPVLAIEVDGYCYHKQGTKQAERDRMKEKILKKYDIPLERFRTNGSGEKEKLLKKLKQLI